MPITGRNQARGVMPMVMPEDASIGNATNIGIPNAPMVQPTGQEQQQQPQVATTIAWEDAEPPAGQPQEPVVDQTGGQAQVEHGTDAAEGVPSDAQIDQTTTEGVKSQLEGQTTPELTDEASQWMGESTGLASAIANLDKGIEKQESRRNGMMLMVFGLSMLSGNGMGKSIQAANTIGGFNKQRLNALYDQRKEIQNRITNKALNDAGYYSERVTDAVLGGSGSGSGSVGDQGFLGSDDKIYFQGPNNTWVDSNNVQKPDNVTLKGKAGTIDIGDLPARVQGDINDLNNSARSIEQTNNRIDFVLGQGTKSKGWEGAAGRGENWWRQFWGNENDYSTWRTQVAGLINDVAIGSLPPGVASDKDIELVLRGVPRQFADKGEMERFFRAAQELGKYQAARNRAEAQFVTKNRGQVGDQTFDQFWQQSEQYKAFQKKYGEGSQNYIDSGGAITSQSGNVEVDLDLSSL